VVKAGSDKLITGYVDRFIRGYDGRRHTVSVSGRGKTQDLVDCSAEWPTGQITGSNVLQIAQKLSMPYGIKVSCIGDPGTTIPQFNLTLGETAYDIIERICRWVGLLAYEDVDGNLILANTQTTKAANGFTEGDNVLSAHVVDAMDQRFSEYDAELLSLDVLGDAGQGGNLIGKATDPNVLRHRLTYLIAEAGGGGQDVCLKRAKWEAARRAGRGRNAAIVTTGWRDSAGTLWTPNTVAPISLPNLHLDGVTWTIGEVTYRQGAGGKTAELVQMDPSAYQPEPILLQPQFLDVKPAAPAAPGP
jgi:prophage tail gpP-like protein